MPSRLERWLPVAVVVAMLLPVSGAAGQETQLASRGPRFLLAGWSASLEQDASGAPVLHRRVSLDLTGVTLDEALKEITRQGGLEISYSPRVVPVDRPVSLHAREITVAAALTEVLLDAAVDVSVARSGQLALVQRVRPPFPAAPDTGAVAGRVTDATTGSPLVGATVSVDGARQSGTTDANGRYRLAGLTARTYTVRARYIGYTPARAMVEVRAGEEVEADFSLTRSAQELNQVAVTGTIVPTEVKALPTPVSVITGNDIAEQRPGTVQELFRQAVPGAVSWDYSPFPFQTTFSARGATTFTPGSGQMKVFVDGIESANPTFAAVDPSSIDRIEVIRGPQAAAIYGSDAIGGVIQIFTKRGGLADKSPRVNAEAAVGVVQTPYAGFDGVLRQQYKASVAGGAPNASYNVGAAYSRTEAFVPDGEQSNPSAFGGMHFDRGPMSVDLSARYDISNAPQVDVPALYEAGLVVFSRPAYQHNQVQNQTYGARLAITPKAWWQSVLTVGIDRYTLDAPQVQRRLRTPDDTLFFVLADNQTKTSIGFTSSLQGRIAAGITGSVLAGFDHYTLPADQWYTFGAVSTTGTIQLAPGNSFTVSRSITNNTGYFTQLQLGFRDVLFVTAGLRAEENTNFGEAIGTPVSPRAGVSYAQHVGTTTFKLRGSYGRAIRPPSPGQKFALSSPASVTLANPALGPERQGGWDAGLDVAVGARGSLSFTYYNQTAEDLIQYVLLQASPLPTSQYQNVGRVKNTGVEVEGTISAGPVKVKAQYGYARSRIDELPPTYSGDLRVGDQSLGTPKHTAGGAVTLAAFRGTHLAAGLTYVGSWRYYDFLAEFRCFGGTGPCQSTLRDYIIDYPAFIKVNATATQQIADRLAGFISVENATNRTTPEFSTLIPVTGRVTTVGFRFER